MLGSYRTPEGITEWQDTRPPTLSLIAKARRYQDRLEAHHQTPEGLIRYRRSLTGSPDPSYGNLGDGCFHTGIYLASQALRYAATGEPAAREQVLRSIGALELLMEVTGKRGLLARHFSPAGTVDDLRWLPSSTRPEYAWKPDVSKDQYAGFIHGLGVAFALMKEPEIQARVGRLTAAAADHLIENDLRIIDADGHPTTYGDLSGRFLCVPLGVNALISLAIAKVAAESTAAGRYRDFYAGLVARGFDRLTYWAYCAPLGVGNRTNDNMSYLALYPLLLLERSPDVEERLREGAERTWRHVKDERNAFFAFVHAALVAGKARGAATPASVREAAGAGREALLEFPEDKVEWPVDLTRPGFDYPRRFLNSRKCEPQTTVAVPLYLRPRGSSFWASDPYRLVGSLSRHGERENAGMDYLLAYWMGRYHDFIAPED